MRAMSLIWKMHDKSPPRDNTKENIFRIIYFSSKGQSLVNQNTNNLKIKTFEFIIWNIAFKNTNTI